MLRLLCIEPEWKQAWLCYEGICSCVIYDQLCNYQCKRRMNFDFAISFANLIHNSHAAYSGITPVMINGKINNFITEFENFYNI